MNYVLWFGAALCFPFAVGRVLASVRPRLARAAYQFAPHFVLLSIITGGLQLDRAGVSALRLGVLFACVIAMWSLAVAASIAFGLERTPA